MKKATIPQPSPEDLARVERMIERAADQILSTVVDRGIRPDVLQEALKDIFTEWDRQRVEAFASKLADLGMMVPTDNPALFEPFLLEQIECLLRFDKDWVG